MADEFSKHESEVNDDTVDPNELADIVKGGVWRAERVEGHSGSMLPEKRSAKRVVALAGISE